jgi:hypothetical protein
LATGVVLTIDGKTVVVKLTDVNEAETKPGTGDSPDANKEPPRQERSDRSSDSAATDTETQTDKSTPNPQSAEDSPTVESSTDHSSPQANRAGVSLQVGDRVAIAPFGKPTAEELKLRQAQEIRNEVDEFTRDVTLGNWGDVKAFLAMMKPDDADKVYAHLLEGLAGPAVPGNDTVSGGSDDDDVATRQQAMRMQQMESSGQSLPTNILSPDDILQLAEAAPKPIRVLGSVRKPGESSPVDGEVVAGEPQVPGSGEAPPNVVLPPGTSLDQLPPEVRQQLENQLGQSGQAARTSPADPIAALAKLISISAQRGNDFSGFARKLAEGTTHFGLDSSENAWRRLRCW